MVALLLLVGFDAGAGLEFVVGLLVGWAAGAVVALVGVGVGVTASVAAALLVVSGVVELFSL